MRTPKPLFIVVSLLLLVEVSMASPYVLDHLLSSSNPYRNSWKREGVDPFIEARYRNLEQDLSKNGYDYRLVQGSRSVGWTRAARERWAKGERTGLQARPSSTSLHLRRSAFDLQITSSSAGVDEVFMRNGFYRPIETLRIRDVNHIELNPYDELNQIMYFDPVTQAINDFESGFLLSQKQRQNPYAFLYKHLSTRYGPLPTSVAYETYINEVHYTFEPELDLLDNWQDFTSLADPTHSQSLFDDGQGNWTDRFHIDYERDHHIETDTTSAWEDQFLNDFSNEHQFKVDL